VENLEGGYDNRRLASCHPYQKFLQGGRTQKKVKETKSRMTHDHATDEKAAPPKDVRPSAASFTIMDGTV